MGSEPDNDTLENISYIRSMGAYRPHFAGIPEQYYPLNKKEVCFYIIFVIGTICFSLGIMIGLLRWALEGFLGYIDAITAFFCFFFVGCVLLLYAGGRDRIRQERELIEENQRKEAEMVKGKNSRRDK